MKTEDLVVGVEYATRGKDRAGTLYKIRLTSLQRTAQRRSNVGWNDYKYIKTLPAEIWAEIRTQAFSDGHSETYPAGWHPKTDGMLPREIVGPWVDHEAEYEAQRATASAAEAAGAALEARKKRIAKSFAEAGFEVGLDARGVVMSYDDAERVLEQLFRLDSLMD